MLTPLEQELLEALKLAHRSFDALPASIRLGLPSTLAEIECAIAKAEKQAEANV